MGIVRDIAKEAVKALAVLALVFLSFAHQPVQVPTGDDGFSFAVSDLSYCGAVDGDAGGHAPCHACRVSLADLPPPPCVAEPAYLAFATLDYAPADSVAFAQPGYTLRNPRAPPATV